MSEDPIAAAQADGRSTLTEAEAKSLLADAGIETPAFAVAADSDGAVDAAEDIGFPVVVKVSSPSVTHKSEWADGAGVAIGLDSAAAVREAAAEIFDAADARASTPTCSWRKRGTSTPARRSSSAGSGTRRSARSC
ncbi:acetate--CoA ligase family protein [Halobacterium sp. CBA1126]|uniref:acetate--CoA ligase family protein n=1 Tax=Halobacterium sp. CBA1126 TaxID=2668074 RepID=UPI0022B24E25|nr:acetate--CoA ligase family protein [Halobacterium sp. CBA1126]